MVIATHVVFGTYGFWLPNDPRGSWSTFVGSRELYRFGPATKVNETRSLANRPHDQQLRQAAKDSLKFPPVVLTGRQALAIAAGFRQASEESGYLHFACSILPEHVHLVTRQHDRNTMQIVAHLKGRATQHLKDQGLWPDVSRPVWSRGCWQVFLKTPADVERAIRYVEQNPIKDGKRAQSWPWITPFTP
ncbi:MAG: hypothetical protein KF861_09820 [Planctomycetaceae bacterium]|nr:hypothetical protein [Planctomycetaceae bacterium]